MELVGVLPNEILITSHLGADFDSFGSLIAASCFFGVSDELSVTTQHTVENPSRPILIWPQSNEDAMNTFIKDREDTLKKRYNFFRNLKDVPEWSTRLKALVVVDTRKLSRLKHIQELLDHFGIGSNCLPDKKVFQVIVVDHHPTSDFDIQAHQVIHHLWGSATSILVHTMLECSPSLQITGEEATWMILGIYNDTGAFTYASTTQFDLSAASWLRAVPCMDMPFVQSYMHQQFERNHSLQHPAMIADEETFKVSLQMQESAKQHTIYGHTIVICHVILPDYMRNFSSSVEAFSEQHQGIINLVVLARFGSQVVMIGRSKRLTFDTGGIDMGLVCKPFGGGGHFAAASATIKSLSFHQVLEELLAHLISLCGPKYTVLQLMTKSPITLSSTQSVWDALQVFQEHSIKAIPVLHSSKFVGIVDRATTFDCASDNKSTPISSIINRDVSTLPEEAVLDQAIELIYRKHQRIVPIFNQAGELIGVLSRSDLVNHFLKERNQFSEHPINEKINEKNMKDTLQKKFSAAVIGLLTKIGSLADSYQGKVYLVGKALRCALADLPIPPVIQILAEQSPSMGSHFIESVTQMLVEIHAGSICQQSEHQAAVLCKFKSGQVVTINIALATLEQYPRASPVPAVHLTPLTMHLYRKPFTVDAIAVCLNEDKFANLVDVCGAAQDVFSKTIEVVDSLAFLELPKRIFKAVLLEHSGFTMGKNCERLIKAAVTQFQVIEKMEGPTLFGALQQVLEQADSPTLLDRLHYFQVLRRIHSGFHSKYIHMQESLKHALQAQQLTTSLFPELVPSITRWKMAFLALTQPLSDEEMTSLVTRLGADSEVQSMFHRTRSKVTHMTSKLKQLEKDEPDRAQMIQSVLTEMQRLEIKSQEIVLVMSARQEAAKYLIAAVTLYNTQYLLAGNDK